MQARPARRQVLTSGEKANFRLRSTKLHAREMRTVGQEAGTEGERGRGPKKEKRLVKRRKEAKGKGGERKQ